jgi:hypothetical protein
MASFTVLLSRNWERRMIEIDKKLELLERDVSDIRHHIMAIEKEDMTGAVSIGSPKGLRDVDPSAHLEEYRASW